jgi:hypothetical protein
VLAVIRRRLEAGPARERRRGWRFLRGADLSEAYLEGANLERGFRHLRRNVM